MKDNTKETINSRFKEVRTALGLTQAELAQNLGLKQNTVGKYEVKNDIPISSMLLLCQLYNINKEWLINGEGEMFLPDDEIRDIAQKYNLSPKAEQVLNNFLKMDGKQRDVFIDGLKQIADITVEIADDKPQMLAASSGKTE